MAAGSLYFRVKNNGAQVFRITEDTNRARTDLVPVATAVLRNGEIRLQGEATLSDAERDEIATWIETRQTADSIRKRQAVEDLADNLGKTAYWVKAEATDEDLDDLYDRLLWGMHDLRTALVRRKSQRAGSDD